MGRARRGGRDISGWLAVDKPAGLTSAQAVAIVRRQLAARKAGHAGTLDKPATGLLAVALGEATKTVPFVMDSRKTYTFTVKFGAATTTDDATGEIIAASELWPSDGEISRALARFRGEIMQIPPTYSAVKIAGRRAAARAVSGEKAELAPRALTVHRLDLTKRPEPDLAEFEIVCGKGGYVRSIARDLGEDLGCLGHVLALRRTVSGPFSIADCVKLSLESESPLPADLMRRLKPVETGLCGLPEIACGETEAARIRTGVGVRAERGELQDGTAAWASCQGKAVAVGALSEGWFRPKRVFRNQNSAQTA